MVEEKSASQSNFVAFCTPVLATGLNYISQSRFYHDSVN